MPRTDKHNPPRRKGTSNGRQPRKAERGAIQGNVAQ